jgi:uncharacterized damage-inducible protein DinB
MTRLFLVTIRPLLLALALTLAASPVLAQAPPAAADTANPLMTTVKSLYEGVVRNVAESAEKVPEDVYAFKPSPDVRSFGEMIGHVTEALSAYCARAVGKPAPLVEVERTKKTKGELVGALKEARGYCDGVYGSMTDADAMKPIKMGQNEAPAVRLLIANISHANEHYGNLVTYMRIKGIVPPSTERAQQMRR